MNLIELAIALVTGKNFHRLKLENRTQGVPNKTESNFKLQLFKDDLIV